MNRIALFLALCLSVMTAFAQKADVEVSYKYPRSHNRIYNYHLLANAQQSKFYSPRSEQIDSLVSTPEGAAKFKEMQLAAMKAGLEQGNIVVNKIPRKVEQVYVIKSVADSLVTVYDVVGEEKVYYTEPLAEMTWSIGEASKNILGYECVEATTDYHGRHWTAWFAPEIPISDGPWKFCGLPGLILEATDSTGQHSFVADGIEKTDKTIGGVYGAGTYDKADRISVLKTRRARADNPQGALNARGIDVTIKSSDVGEKQTADFIETDYR